MRIRKARPADVPAILGLIRGLARYERLESEVSATEDGLRRYLFGRPRFAEALLAVKDGEALGFALFFHNFSTFLGRPGLYLEDLFVRPEHRSRGIGFALLKELGRIAARRGCGRLEWAVLDWNRDAISFYERLGARAMSEWTVYRLAGAALERLPNL